MKNIFTLAAQYLAMRVETMRRSYVSMRYEPPNVSSSATVQTVQAAIRAAEGGETRQLFALYRDLTVSGSHIQCELGKRLMAVLSQPEAVLPADKENPDDVAAAVAIERMIADCENWDDGIAHLLSSTLWPVAVVEKLYEPNPEPRPGEKALKFTLRKFNIVNPTVLCFQQPYQTGANGLVSPQLKEGEEQWEEDLRFYGTDVNGNIQYSYASSYPAEKQRHIIHRGHLLVGVRDNWGGPMRAVVFWWLLGVLGRDWFARAMERYGAPFPVGKTDAQNPDAVNLLREAFSLSTKIGGLVVDNETQVELIEAVSSNLADAHEKFLGICNREVSKIIVGQELSTTAAPTGLGSGVAKLQGQVREDIREYDQRRLAATLKRQLFDQFLFINGLRGRVKIVWGGLSAEDAKSTADLLVSLSSAGLEPTDEAIPTISERVGFELQRKELPEPMPGMSRFSADLPRVTHPSDAIAQRKAKALGEAYRGSLAPVRVIIMNSRTPEEAEQRMALFFADWKPERVRAITEEALQIQAAAGAAAAKPQ